MAALSMLHGHRLRHAGAETSTSMYRHGLAIVSHRALCVSWRTQRGRLCRSAVDVVFTVLARRR